MDFDDQDNEIAVELLNNQSDDELAAQDAERQVTTGAGGCLSLVIIAILALLLT